jgi:arylsulfatase A-like enzyme
MLATRAPCHRTVPPLTDTDTPHRHPTPFVMQRARGLRLTDFHAGSSVCTPSRAALMTGRHGLRTGVNANFNPYSLGGLPLSEVTLAELLRGVGYRTAMAGKWHLGHVPPHGPMHRGFDSWLGAPMPHGCP